MSLPMRSPPVAAVVRDRYAFAHSRPASADALEAFETAVAAVLAHRPTGGPALDRVLAADPGHIAALALKGLAGVILARGETVAVARGLLAAARAAAAEAAPTADETALVAALGEAVEGRLAAAADRLDLRLAGNRQAALLVKLSHALRFMAGDLPGMRRTTAAALDAFAETTPGYGFVLGCHAFCLEEAGDYAAAERAGRRAVAAEPDDAWGLHAVAHVHEMTRRPADGIAWLEQTRPSWTGCNNFAFHVAWHLALFHLEGGDVERVLALYDAEVRPQPTDDVRDVANAASLLWRLRQDGVDVGGRWQELAEIARARRHETTLMFGSLHHLFALVAVGDRAAAADLLAAVARCAAEGDGDQRRVAGDVGLDLARLLAGERPALAPPPLVPLAARLRRLGGSNAQRDVFLRSLVEAAAEAGAEDAATALLAARAALKRPDRFAERTGRAAVMARAAG